MVKKTKTATFVTIFVVVIFVLGLRYLHWINFIEKPVVAIVDWSLKPINNVKSFFIKREKNFTIDELNTIEDSKKENEVLKTQVQLLSEDNEELKKQLNFFVNKNFLLLIILFYHFFTFYPYKVAIIFLIS